MKEPGTGKIIGWDRVPGWDSDTDAADSGCESDWPGATDGDWSGFIYNLDPSVYQLTDFTIPDGVTFTLKVDAQDNSAPGAQLQMSLFYDDAGTRVEAASTVVEPVWPWAEYTLSFNVADMPESIGHNIGIEFENISEGYSWIGLDNIRLDVDFCGIVYPPDGAANIPIDADLIWTLKDGMTCDVYFATDPNALAESQVIFGEAATTYDPGTLDFDTTYYWRVDPIDPNTGEPVIYLGTTWSFTTMRAEVFIVTQPQGVTVPVMNNAVFTVEAVSPTPITYAWYKVGNEVDILSSTDTLTIPNVQTGDEGYYYCKLTNDKPDPVISARAQLLIERLVGWWKLEGNAADSVNLEVPGVPANNGVLPEDPNFIADGIEGGGYEFFGDGRVIEIADSNEYFNFYPRGYTISAWVKNPNDGWGGIVGKQNVARTPDYGWVLNHNSNTAYSTLRQTPDHDYGANVGLMDGQWHMVTGMFDAEIGQVRLYVDGELVAQSGEGITDISGSATSMVIGAESTDGASPMSGIVDDVKLWSYPLDSVEVAMQYIDFNAGKLICVNQDDPWMHFDVAGEPGETSYCRIDIEDFAELALTWMKCNLVPECLP